ncbi:MAG: right-handed parallel beta-helix repeat-containing protein [Candidatus Eisenbacteria bacterium]|nr:right-handed parallel beta-helix repeat-containing protein [Candidatus Eisenbacteria bacterium]
MMTLWPPRRAAARVGATPPAVPARPGGRVRGPFVTTALLASAALLAAGAAGAAEIVVRPQGPGHLPIQDALERARAGDVVLVEPGNYRERLEIPSGVTLRSRAGAARTVIQGDGTGSILLVRAADTLVTIEGFTFLGGGATGILGRGLAGGGAILCDESNVVIRRNVFRANRLPGRNAVGGAVAIFGGYVSIEDNRFEDNMAVRGGGLYVRGHARVVGNEFVRNRCSQYGGGLYVERAVGVVERNIFRTNFAGWGGGLCVGRLTEVKVFRNTLVENHSVQWGGAMFVLESEPTVERNLLLGNTSDFRGGGFASGAFGFPVLRDNLGWNNRPFNFFYAEDTLDIAGSVEQLEADPKLADYVRGDLHPRRGGPAAGPRGPIGALDPVDRPLRPKR